MIEVVLARHAETVAWRELLPELPFWIYNKGEPFAEPGPRARRERLPNVGREAHTYLHHICRRYHELPEVTVLGQADPFEHCPDFVDRVRPLSAAALAAGRGISLSVRYKEGIPDPEITGRDFTETLAGFEVRLGNLDWGLDVAARRRRRPRDGWLGRVWATYFLGPRPHPWRLGYGALWAVPRAALHARPLRFWERLRDRAATHAGPGLGPGNPRGRHPDSPWSLEAAWAYLFDPAWPTRPPHLI